MENKLKPMLVTVMPMAMESMTSQIFWKVPSSILRQNQNTRASIIFPVIRMMAMEFVRMLLQKLCWEQDMI